MNEGGPKKPRVNPVDAVSVTNWVLKGLGRGIGAAAKAGHEAYKTRRDDKIEQQSVLEIYDVIFSGARPIPGHPLPAVRTTSLSPDELKRFTDAANRLTAQGIALPNYVTDFASRFFIRLNR